MIHFVGAHQVSTILDYVDAGHDFMLVTDSSASSSVRDLATEFGIDFHHAHSQVCLSCRSNRCSLQYQFARFTNVKYPDDDVGLCRLTFG